ncbi:unnamed protein product [Amoebophrya sp. A120]|nr:unnamed protein product [Amoebophrya sp. A120]|eukprot:GSA120T00017765001.1
MSQRLSSTTGRATVVQPYRRIQAAAPGPRKSYKAAAVASRRTLCGFLASLVPPSAVLDAHAEFLPGTAGAEVLNKNEDVIPASAVLVPTSSDGGSSAAPEDITASPFLAFSEVTPEGATSTFEQLDIRQATSSGRSADVEVPTSSSAGERNYDADEEAKKVVLAIDRMTTALRGGGEGVEAGGTTHEVNVSTTAEAPRELSAIMERYAPLIHAELHDAATDAEEHGEAPSFRAETIFSFKRNAVLTKRSTATAGVCRAVIGYFSSPAEITECRNCRTLKPGNLKRSVLRALREEQRVEKQIPPGMVISASSPGVLPLPERQLGEQGEGNHDISTTTARLGKNSNACAADSEQSCAGLVLSQSERKCRKQRRSECCAWVREDARTLLQEFEAVVELEEHDEPKEERPSRSREKNPLRVALKELEAKFQLPLFRSTGRTARDAVEVPSTTTSHYTRSPSSLFPTTLHNLALFYALASNGAPGPAARLLQEVAEKLVAGNNGLKSSTKKIIAHQVLLELGEVAQLQLQEALLG